ncbi:class I SAM-dependent methyltransferase [Halomonas citrativorans]|uniref:Class I SAM-dependent methyltransferase n=1 Tax=Halomonas citrativorans TaxID=2742612 RepID=A0ABR9FFB5_9GAMM|nr:class I SAM-dependent methyltransferase [Halomonas citrativorans]MBE0405181.1 class I SAM-dependent methyltransferase [Halomonas citrativorans]
MRNHLNWVAKNSAEARLKKLLDAQKTSLPAVDTEKSSVKDGFYRAFEDKFRGTREEIKRRVRVYLPFVMPIAARHPGVSVLDLGCGRGEWLEVLKEAEIEGEGVDQDAGMLEGAHEQGLNVYQGDAIAFLQQQPSGTRICISLMHVVEHIPFDVLREVVSEAKRVLVPDGILILETPNPENFMVGSCNFYMDPTHRNPLPPPLLAFVPEYYGFEKTKILRLQETEEAKNKAFFSMEDFLTNISPDYSIVARASAVPEQEVNSEEAAAWNKDYGISFSWMVSQNASNGSTKE